MPSIYKLTTSLNLDQTLIPAPLRRQRRYDNPYTSYVPGAFPSRNPSVENGDRPIDSFYESLRQVQATEHATEEAAPAPESPWSKSLKVCKRHDESKARREKPRVMRTAEDNIRDALWKVKLFADTLETEEDKEGVEQDVHDGLEAVRQVLERVEL